MMMRTSRPTRRGMAGRRRSILFAAVLLAGMSGLPGEGAAVDKQFGNLIFHAPCDNNVNCPADAIGKGLYKVIAKEPGSHGVLFFAKLLDVQDNSALVTLTQVTATFRLSVNFQPCQNFSSPVTPFRREGLLLIKFWGDEASPPIPDTWTSLSLCTDGVLIRDTLTAITFASSGMGQ